jgi:hypothetical protein
MPIQEITTPLSTSETSRTRSDPFLHCPSLDDMCDIESPKDFADLPAGDNNILQGRPNHFLISGIHFIHMNGRRSFPAADLAMSIVSSMLRFPEANDENRGEQGEGDQDSDDEHGLDQESELINESRAHHEALLAYLWTISQSFAPSIRLTDPPDDPALGGRIQEFRSMLLPLDPTESRAGNRDHPETAMGERTVLATATQGLISTLATIDKDRQESRKQDQAEKSVLRNLGQPQLALFKRLCTTSYDVPGEYPPTMIRFTQEKSTIRAANQMTQKTRQWSGTFSEAALSTSLWSGVCFAKLHLETPTLWILALIISSLLSAGIGPSAEVHMEEH